MIKNIALCAFLLSHISYSMEFNFKIAHVLSIYEAKNINNDTQKKMLLKLFESLFNKHLEQYDRKIITHSYKFIINEIIQNSHNEVLLSASIIGNKSFRCIAKIYELFKVEGINNSLLLYTNKLQKNTSKIKTCLEKLIHSTSHISSNQQMTLIVSIFYTSVKERLKDYLDEDIFKACTQMALSWLYSGTISHDLETLLLLLKVDALLTCNDDVYKSIITLSNSYII